METLLSITPNYLSRIILIVIMTAIECYCYYIFFRWIMIKDEEQKRKAVKRIIGNIIFLMLFSIFVVIEEKFLGMIGIYVNIIIGIYIFFRTYKKATNK